MTSQIVSRWPSIFAALLLMCACNLFAAESAAMSFDLPADSAEKALKRFSEQAGLEVLFPTQVARSVQTKPVKGEMTPRVAIEAMLAGTGLVVIEDEKTHVFSVRKGTPVEEKNGSSRPASDRTAQNKTHSAAGGEAVLELDPFTLTGTRTRGYGVTASLGGTRIVLPLIDTPVSIVTVNRELMDDVGAANGADGMRWVSGLGPAANPGIGAYSLRGQLPRGATLTSAGSTDVIDGLPGGGLEQETEFIDRFEVVKGAAGTLYGEHNLGGLINRVYKTPRKEAHTTIKTWVSTIGGTFQGSIDNTGSIDRDGEFTYRVIGVFRDGKTSFDGDDSKNAYYGVLEYRPQNGRTKFWGRYEYRYIEANLAQGGTIVDGAGVNSMKYFGRRNLLPFINHDPRIFRYYEFGFSTSTSGKIGDWDLRFVGRMNDDIILGNIPHLFAQAYTMIGADGASLGTIGYNINLGAANTQPTFAGTPWVDIKLTDVVPSTVGPTRNQTSGFFVDLSGNFNTGPVNHRTLIYAQTMNFRQRSIFKNLVFKPEYGGQLTAGNLNIANAFSIVHPVYRDVSWDLFLPPTIATNNSASNNKFAIGLQDNMSMWDNRLLLVGGVRYDFVQNNGTYNYITNVAPRPLTSSNTVSKASVVVKPFPVRGVAFFANYTETFTARFGELVVGSGIPFKNEEGISKEVGLKLELFDARLTMTGSYFDMVTKNLAIFQANPLTGLNEFTQGGRAPAKGWDADFTWLVNENWAVLLGLADVDSKDFRGLRLRGVMNDFNYKGLVRYSASSTSRLRGLAVGAGVVNTSDRLDTTNTFVVPGYNSYDAFVSYSRKNWRFQVNGYNLTDTMEVDGIIQRSLLFANEPRSFRFSAQYDF